MIRDAASRFASVRVLLWGAVPFPTPLSAYPSANGLLGILQARIDTDPFNLIATGIFLLAVLHTFLAARFTDAAHRMRHRQNEVAAARGRTPVPSVAAELMHLLGEVEVVFALWAIPLVIAIVLSRGWTTATGYLDETVNYTEALFVVVIMALASTRPIIELAEAVLRRVANLGRATPAAWWMAILTVGPLLGSLITEPGAMTISAMLLARQFYDLQPSTRLKYATLGLLFVNISIGGTLTHFAAPPILMVARPWGWDTAFFLSHFGWRAVLAISVSTLGYFLFFRNELRQLALRPQVPDEFAPGEGASREAGMLPIPGWITAVYVLFIVWTVVNAHHPALFLAGFLFFLGFDRATAAYSTLSDFKTPLLVGFFLAGLVVHGGLQGWWIAPVISSLSETPLFLGATILTAFNDNALITYLATLVPNLSDGLKYAVVEGAVTGGGLTVIANAPNPAGQALLGRFFGGAVHPLYLFAGALIPTVIAAAAFRLL
ncbi:MAG: putative Na+/H+ antiporter [Vicinamibacterales bacterium]